MKRSLTILAVVLAAAALAGCKSGNKLPCTVDELNAAWQAALDFEDMTVDNPEEYLLKDVDGDGIDEIFLRGSGFTAALSCKEKGNPTMLGWTFGEYETFLMTADGYLCKRSESGQDERLTGFCYKKLENSEYVWDLCVNSYFVDDTEEEIDTEYVLSYPALYEDSDGETIWMTAGEAEKYLPTLPEVEVNSLEGWAAL